MITRLYFYAAICGRSIKKKVKSMVSDESGMGTIEVIIIIAVLVALALIFRNFIFDMANGIFEKIKNKADSAIDDI